MKTMMKYSAMLAAAIASATAVAGDNWNCYESKTTDFQSCAYVGAGLGYAHLDPDSSDTSWQESGKGNLGNMLFAGFQFAPSWFVDVAYADLGEVDMRNANLLVPFQGRINYQVPNVMMGYYLDIPGLSIDPFIKAGVSAIQNSASSNAIVYEEEKDVQLALGAGFDWRLAQHWKMRTAVESYDEDALFAYVGVAYIFGEGKAKPVPAPAPQPAPEPAPAPAPEPEPVVVAPPAPVVTQELCEVFDGTLEGVHFKTASAELTDSAKTTLAKTAKVLKQFPAVKLEVHAHTDSQGSDSYNQTLSDNRARSVMDYFIAEGVDAARMTSKGFGETQPVADNANADGRALNRRVELVSHIEQCKQQ